MIELQERSMLEGLAATAERIATAVSEIVSVFGARLREAGAAILAYFTAQQRPQRLHGKLSHRRWQKARTRARRSPRERRRRRKAARR